MGRDPISSSDSILWMREDEAGPGVQVSPNPTNTSYKSGAAASLQPSRCPPHLPPSNFYKHPLPCRDRGHKASAWKAQVYREELPEDVQPFRDLLQSYSKIPPEEVDDHLHRIVSE
ncbi:hypothetical protein VTK73DRAFT_2357 [Phialemonium thermophilum]|uniref:Uncharacterized protein n=1 Tax=Phialemonium thermophilum TaxID=223376 RepID=A0ABR3VS87_9PEZI